MGPLDILLHVSNFIAPALIVALLLALLGRAFPGRKARGQSLWARVAINFAAGVAVLAAGVVVFGHDGMMATYAALVVVMGTSQWLAGRRWRG
jgi:hypothetical protein